MPPQNAGFEVLRVGTRRPRLPEGLRIYAIGDIHGRIDLLEDLLAQTISDIDVQAPTRPVYVFLGDYIDRGPASRETIDKLIKHGESYESVFLRGNHEQIAIKCLSDRSLFDQWMRLGGMETLLSYGVRPDASAKGRQIVQLQTAFHEAIPREHFRFFSDLKNSFSCGDFFFAHAGARPNIELSRQKESDLLWIRGEFLTSNFNFGKIVVHGHTPSQAIELGANRINIDTGAFATGCLSCLVLEGDLLRVLDTSLQFQS